MHSESTGKYTVTLGEQCAGNTVWELTAHELEPAQIEPHEPGQSPSVLCPEQGHGGSKLPGICGRASPSHTSPPSEFCVIWVELQNLLGKLNSTNKL